LRDDGSKDAIFYYVTVWNRGIKTAENVVPHVLIDEPQWKGTGLMRLFVVPKPAWPIYLIDHANEETSDDVRFVRALVEHARREDVMWLSGKGLPETFALIVTVKGLDDLHIPTTGPHPAFIRYPCKFKMYLYFEVKDRPYTHAATYEIEATAWDKVRVSQH
jgi:hypothetical protein